MTSISSVRASERALGRVEGEVVAPGDDEVGDLDHLGKALAGLVHIAGAGEDRALLEVLAGGDGIAGDPQRVARAGDDEAAEAGRDAREREEVEAFAALVGEVVGGGLAPDRQSTRL